VWQQVDALVYFFLFPVLLFHSIVRHPLDVSQASTLMLAGALLGLGAIALAYSLPHWPGLKGRWDRRLHAASAQVAFRFNSFIALAVTEKLLGSEGLLLIAVLIGVCVPIFNVAAVYPMAKHVGRGLGRELARNPLIWGTGLGLSANLLHLTLPEWLAPTVGAVGQSGLVLGLMAAGAGMRLDALKQAPSLSVAVLGIRHVATPLLAAGLAWLFGLQGPQAMALLVFSAIPTASSCYVLAARMGYDGPYVAGLVTLSTLLGMLSLPLTLAWLVLP
jgi:malonate transporter